MTAAASSRPPTERRPRSAAGLVLGVGLGGFFDGITLHQIAQWHNMGSAKLPPVTMEAMKQNMMWDGLFHAGVWVASVVGVYLLLRDARAGWPLPSARAFTGQMLVGWGAFNLVEGVIDHHLLELHHVRDLPVHVPSYDWIFLVVGGIGLVALGWLMSRGGYAEGRVRP
ncbi:MAG TPA: DUF2243 domain-containing protein [Thermoanaerobaculia bacterium]|nr:DUF2243 domain-containing protein [Thermoanaerobaculia bacterium]